MTSGGLPTGQYIIYDVDVIMSFLQVAAFIKSERPSRYPGLTIKYVRGADPIIKVSQGDVCQG